MTKGAVSNVIDIVIVYHNEKNKAQTDELVKVIEALEPGVSIYTHSNMEQNIGFAAGCNRGAKLGTGEVIGFLNPDVIIDGPFSDIVEEILVGDVVVTGNRFGKPQSHLDIWGVKEWVCGASFFTKRSHFESLGGFDEQFVWSFEETDFIRRTEKMGGVVVPADLPIRHESPSDDSEVDRAYKDVQFRLAQKRYYDKWTR